MAEDTGSVVRSKVRSSGRSALDEPISSGATPLRRHPNTINGDEEASGHAATKYDVASVQNLWGPKKHVGGTIVGPGAEQSGKERTGGGGRCRAQTTKERLQALQVEGANFGTARGSTAEFVRAASVAQERRRGTARPRRRGPDYPTKEPRRHEGEFDLLARPLAR